VNHTTIAPKPALSLA